MRWKLLAGLAIVVACAGITPAFAKKTPANPKCDPIDATDGTAACLMPFPDDFFTVADPASATGRRLAYTSDVMPQNNNGVPVDPTDIDRSDGFSPGAEIVVDVPGIDVAKSNIARITDIAKSLAPNAPIVLLDTATGRRVPYWAEIDTWGSGALVIRPARNFLESHRIVVALRDLRDAKGHRIAAPRGFATLRDRHHVGDGALLARRPAIERVLADLEYAGIETGDLYLAWDFTVASEQGLAGGMLHMRDDAYAQLGTGVPTFQVTSVDTNPNADIARRVRGTFDVPMYLTGTGQPGSRLQLDDNGMPVRTGVFHAEFRCLIPNSAIAHPGRAWVYGHGLLGGTSEIEGFAPFLNQYDIVLCATPEIGMSSEDVPNVLQVILNFSLFGSIPDRLQQGMLNMQWLARLMKDARGFGADSAFQFGATSSIVPGDVFYNGNSQGGIFGGAATAISKEWTRAVLGVPGINYSELLPRSVDFDQFLAILNTSYPDPTVHTLLVAMGQTLWDRGEPDGYAQHMTDDAYPDTPRHKVLLIEAFGDHQVANISTETEARTIGAYVHTPVIAPGRSNDVTPMWDIPPVPSSPFDGSVLELWDFGTPAPPIESVPNRAGSDPHGAARNVPAVRDQVSQFLAPNGAYVDVCGANPCAP